MNYIEALRNPENYTQYIVEHYGEALTSDAKEHHPRHDQAFRMIRRLAEMMKVDFQSAVNHVHNALEKQAFNQMLSEARYDVRPHLSDFDPL